MRNREANHAKLRAKPRHNQCGSGAGPLGAAGPACLQQPNTPSNTGNTPSTTQATPPSRTVAEEPSRTGADEPSRTVTSRRFPSRRFPSRRFPSGRPCASRDSADFREYLKSSRFHMAFMGFAYFCTFWAP